MSTGIIVPTVGKAAFIAVMAPSAVSGQVAKPTAIWLSWGTGTTTPAAGDTAMQVIGTDTTPSVAATVTIQTVTTTGDTIQAVGTITCSLGGGEAITELGMFMNSAGGTMLLHAVQNAMNLNQNDSITFTVQIKQS